MGKKHKKQNKPDRYLTDEFDVPMEKSSLKLVLKVSGAPSTPEIMVDSLTDDNFSDTDRKQRHKKKKRHHEKHCSHRHHEKKDYRKPDADTDYGEDSEEELEPAAKRLYLDVEEEDDHLRVRNLREKKTTDDDKMPLQFCLDYLHKILQRKDTNGFFAFPVTDNIAPGYSSIISYPMDFSTMKTKIDDGAYATVADFKSDYELMMNNCMTYNHPDTVYHREAKRMLLVGLRHMSREKLLHMKRGLPFMAGVTKEELGFDEETTSAVDDGGNGIGDRNRCSKVKGKQKKSGIGRFEAIPDDLTPEEILDQTQSAAQEAANRLLLQSPNSKIGFLRRNDDGTTTLNILNPDDSGFVSDKERVVSLGSLIGKLTTGSSSLIGIKEDKRNKVNPVIYLNYGAFSSYAPVYDSSSASICKEDSDLLLSTYADESGLQYAKSLRHFVADAGDYTISMVDDLLNVLTSGEHSTVIALLEKREEKEAQQKQETDITEQNDEALNAMSSLSNNNLDDFRTEMSYVNSCDQELQHLDSGSQETQMKLDHTAELLLDLQRSQYERLSEKLPEHLAYVKDPTKEEMELANKVTKELTQLVKQVTPGDIVKLEGVRSAMGIEVLTGSDDNTLRAAASSTSSWQLLYPAARSTKSGDQNEKTGQEIGAMSEVDDEILDMFQNDTAGQEHNL